MGTKVQVTVSYRELHPHGLLFYPTTLGTFKVEVLLYLSGHIPPGDHLALEWWVGTKVQVTVSYRELHTGYYSEKKLHMGYSSGKWPADGKSGPRWPMTVKCTKLIFTRPNKPNSDEINSAPYP